MQHILVYSDSLSWGIVPTTRRRLPFEQRWPGAMETALCAAGRRVRVIEDCLNGRRTVWDDPFKPGRNGLAGLAQRIEIHSPLALVILMLGTNDFQSMHAHNAWHASHGILALVHAIRTAPIEPGMPVPPHTGDRAARHPDSQGPDRAQVRRRRPQMRRVGRSLSPGMRRSRLPLLRRGRRDYLQQGGRRAPRPGSASGAGGRRERGGGDAAGVTRHPRTPAARHHVNPPLPRRISRLRLI